MPALRGKDIPPGNWRRRQREPEDEDEVPEWYRPPRTTANPLVWHRPRGGRITNVRCQSCGGRMHQILVDDGERYHYLCNPEG